MKKFVIGFLVVIFTADIGLAQGPLIAGRVAGQIGKQTRQNQKQPQSLRPNARPNAGRPGPVPIEDVVEGFYMSQFPVMVEVDDEQFAKIMPFLRQGLRELREITMRKRRAINQLMAMTQRKDEPEENLRRMIREVDKADEDYRLALEKLYSSVDPHLTAHQQARFRVFQDRMPQRIRQMIQSVTPPPGQ